MKNHLEYFYNLKVENISKKNNEYLFMYKGEDYVLRPYKKDAKHLDQLLNIFSILKKQNINSYELIYTTKKNIISIYNKENYILLKQEHMNSNPISIHDLTYLNNFQNSIKPLNTWYEMWTTKIDYIEFQMSQMKAKFPILYENFNYYIGLAENAISYLVNTINTLPKTIYDNDVICHYRLSFNENITSFYNPLNMVIDHKSRDLSEYLKICFKKKQPIDTVLTNYFKKNILSEYGIRLLYARLVFPTYFFDIYEGIIEDNKDEKEILNINSFSEEYEFFLDEVYIFLSHYINIPKIEWLGK